MPVLATTNLKSEEIYIMMEFNVDHIDDVSVIIMGTLLPISKFAQSFIPAFCCTVYKYHVNRMEKKQLYTALSRTTKFNYISISTLAH